MKKQNRNKTDTSVVRRKAELIPEKKSSKTDLKLSEGETQKLIKELEKRKSELELQNAELRQLKETNRERIKELNCLFSIGDLLEKEDSLEKILQGTAELIPNYWFHSEIACARIYLQDRQYQTKNFRETLWRQSANINIDGKQEGMIEVYYLEETSLRDEGPFLKEERSLIKAIAERLGRVAERKRMEKALRDSLDEAQRFRDALDQISSYIYLKDTQSRYVYANRQTLELFGCSSEELAGTDDTSYFPPETVKKLREVDTRVFKGEQTSEEIDVTDAENDRHVYWEVKTPIYTGAERKTICGLLGISTDITKTKLAEQEIKLKNEELQKINTEKDKFFSIIAHDLRAPFQIFLGFTQLMIEELSTLSSDEIRKFAIIMRDSASNLYRLLENLLMWSRLQRGIIEFAPASILLKPNITEGSILSLEAANKKEIEIIFDIRDDITAIADEYMLKSIIRNLTSNAVKFTRRGGKITITAKNLSDNSVEISVKDTGIGMNRKIIDNLYCLEVNSGREGTEGESSTGLGLIICKEFIEKHGSKLRIESEEGKGSKFYFTISGKS